MRTTLGAIRASRIPQNLKLCATDARVTAYVNEAVERLLKRGLWWGCYQKYRVCVSDGCLTWPRHVAAILSVAVDGTPMKTTNEWFEFIENGWGLRDDEFCECKLFDRGTAATFEDIIGVNKHIKVYADVAEDAAAKILLRGNDENGIWIRTLDGATWIDGEYVAIDNVTPQVSTKHFTSVETPIKPVTNGIVRLYEYDPATGNQRAIAIFEPDEERPSYRRSFIPNLGGCAGCDDEVCVTIMAKMEFYPVVNDNDFVLIGNIPALKHATRAVQLDEEGDRAGFAEEFGLAIGELEAELSHYLGPNQYQPIAVNSVEFGGGDVKNVI